MRRRGYRRPYASVIDFLDGFGAAAEGFTFLCQTNDQIAFLCFTGMPSAGASWETSVGENGYSITML